MLGSENLRRVVGIDFHEIRKQLNALLGMWEESLPTGTISSIIWKLLDLATLQKQSWRRDSLSTVPTGLVMIPRMLYWGKKNGVLEKWKAEAKRFNQLRQQDPALVFPTEVLAGVQQDEMYIQLQYLQPQDDVTKDRALKRRKQNPAAVSSH